MNTPGINDIRMFIISIMVMTTLILMHCIFVIDIFTLPLPLYVDLVEFTDEEGYGKYLDLHEVYDKFLNLRGVEV